MNASCNFLIPALAGRTKSAETGTRHANFETVSPIPFSNVPPDSNCDNI